MEESKFLKAQKLKNEISYLENCIEDLKRKNAKICVSWPETAQRITTDYYNLNSISSNYLTRTIENCVKALPLKIEEKVKELLNIELDELNKQFNEL